MTSAHLLPMHQEQAGRFPRSQLIKALAISLGVHGLLLLQTPRLADDGESRHIPAPSHPLQLHLESRSRSPETTPIEIDSADTAPPPSTPSSRHPIATSHARPTSLPNPAQQPPNSPKTSAELPWQSALQPVTTISEHPPSEKSEDIVDAEGLRQYRLELAIAARRFRAMADSIREKEPSGVTEVRVNIDGVTHTLILQSSSGKPSLDQTALRMLDNSVRITPVPPNLRNKPFSVVLRVEFGEE